MRIGCRIIAAAVSAVVLAAACSTSEPLDATATAEAEPDPSATATTPGARSFPTTTTCPPYQPGPMDCPAYDGAGDEAVVGSILSGEGLSVSAPVRSHRTRVLAVGDSILAEAHGYLVPMADGHGLELTVRAVGGTAPCDWVGQLDALLTAHDPDLVMFSFSGNAFTPCMVDRPIGSVEFYEAYRESAAGLNALVADAGGEVWWMEVPPFADTTAEQRREPLHDLYRDAPHTAGIVPTRELFESATGGFATELGCWFRWEQCPSVRVRADDGVHLDNPRSPYGALRYAVSILALADCWAGDGLSVT